VADHLDGAWEAEDGRYRQIRWAHLIRDEIEGEAVLGGRPQTWILGWEDSDAGLLRRLWADAEGVQRTEEVEGDPHGRRRALKMSI
jgi:hypothetical protein